MSSSGCSDKYSFTGWLGATGITAPSRIEPARAARSERMGFGASLDARRDTTFFSGWARRIISV